MAMLNGETIGLRTVLASDVDELYRIGVEIDNRGDFYPRHVQSEPAFRRRFTETGFWTADEGQLLIVDAADRRIGHVSYEKLTGDVQDFELGYRLYDANDRGKGYTTEAVALLVRYLFENGHMNRMRLTIHTDNVASRRVAEKCGFTLEATARQGWYSRGRWHDVVVYTLIRDDLA